jgi:GH18 family chitinase
MFKVFYFEIKVDYIKKHCLGGAMIWSIDLDDFNGFCSNTTYPLTKSILSNLKTIDRKKCASLPRIEDEGLFKYNKFVLLNW